MSPTHGWENFFVAEVGAAAALSGLVFVAVSISLKQILSSHYLRARAQETLLQFLSVLAVGTFGLIPDQTDRLLGAEIAACGALTWIIAARRHLRAQRDPDLDADARRWLWVRVVGAQASSVPFIVAGALLIAQRDRGIAWVVPGTLGAFVAGAFNAWVLLVEIHG